MAYIENIVTKVPKKSLLTQGFANNLQSTWFLFCNLLIEESS